MMPTFNPGETIIASSIPYFFLKPKVGDIILFKNNNKTLVKRIKRIIDGEYYLSGDNINDSLEVGELKRKEILGKVIMKI